MVNMTNCSHVDMRFLSFVNLLSWFGIASPVVHMQLGFAAQYLQKNLHHSRDSAIIHVCR